MVNMTFLMFLLPQYFYLSLVPIIFSTVQGEVFRNTQTTGYFNGSSYVTLNNSFNFYEEIQGFSFRTCKENGSLLHQVTHHGDHLILRLERGKLVVEFQLLLAENASNTNTWMYGTNQLNLNQWVNVDFSATDITVSTSGKRIGIGDVAMQSRLNAFQFRTTTDLYIGSSKGGSNGFVGCMMLGPYLSFNDTSSEYSVLWNACPLQNTSCEAVDDVCLSHPCLNGGSCSASANSSYVCACSKRYTGSNCEIDQGPLCNETLQLCNNHTCVEIDEEDGTVCRCYVGYYGVNCTMNGTNACDSSPCLNDAACTTLNAVNYTCYCKPGFHGAHCEIVHDDCASEPCKNNGTCSDLGNGFICSCEDTGYEGNVCEKDVNECLEEPCKSSHATCFNRPGDYLCLCPSGFEGENCDVSINYCSMEPCQNEALCLKDDDHGYDCICLPGFTGVHCEAEIDYCIGNDCHPISQLCVSDHGRHYCKCREGYGGAHCEEINECENHPCLNDATCVDEINAFSCLCVPGYTGSWCQSEVNECAEHPCVNDAPCNDLINDYYCECNLGWTGKNCSQDFNPCLSQPCHNHASCTTLLHTHVKGYSCACPTGFSGYNCETNIDDCIGIECGYNEICIDGVNSYSCDCILGYTRDDQDNCTIDINECASLPCQNNATCLEEVGFFSCNCTFGYEGDTCERETNFCDLNRCSEHSICKPEFGKYTCFCMPGYVGQHCESAYEACSSDPCMHGECVGETGYYWCNCSLGYDGINCERNINECLSDPCLNGATCNDLIGQFNCTCAEGWSGNVCDVNVDECASEPCLNGANCTDLVAGYDCSCVTGYVGKRCDVDINECESSPCQHDGSCIDEIGRFRCICRGTGYEGEICETEVNDCAVQPCKNQATCVDQFKDYDCRCQDGYTGKDCEIKSSDPSGPSTIDVSECRSNPCFNGGTCLEFSNQTLYYDFFLTNFSYENAAGFVCGCAPGYEGLLCADEINECEMWDPCYHAETCIDMVNDYNCICSQKYGGRNCSVFLIGCDNEHQCANNGSCIPYLQDEGRGIHNYTCTCAPGFTGKFCTSSTAMSFDVSSYAVFQVALSNTSERFSFEFRTTVPDGFIASISFAEVGGNLTVFMVSGVVYVVTNGDHTAVSGHVPLSDGAWHFVYIDLKETSPFSGKTLANVTLGSNVASTLDGFVGCMRDVKVDDVMLLLQDAVEFLLVKEGCVKNDVCSEATCSGRGKCVDLWTKFDCICDRPFVGRNCSVQVRSATFGYLNESSYAIFDLAEEPYTEFRASLFLLTRNGNGLVLSTSASSSASTSVSSFLKMDLHEGGLRVEVNGESFVREATLDDGQYHFIDVSLQRNLLSILVDNTSFSRFNLSSSINITTTRIYIGGLPSTASAGRRKRLQTSFETSRYKGIFQDIEVNGQLLLVFPDDVPAESGFRRSYVLPVEAVSVLRGKISDPLCGSMDNNVTLNPCLNDAVCETTFNDYVCKCTDKWRGGNCEIPIFCKQISCPAELECTDLARGGFQCVGSATFDESSQPAGYSYNGPNLTLNTIFFGVRTRSVNVSVLVLQSESGSIRFDLVSSGSLVLTLSSSNETESIFLDTVVADGQWHNVSILLQDNDITLIVDSSVAHFATFTSETFIQAILWQTNNSIHVGGPSPYLFKGCIRDARIGNEVIPFYDPSLISNHPLVENASYITNTKKSSPIFLGCHGDDVCNLPTNPCENNGTCMDLFNLVNCTCKPGFTGATCEFDINECDHDSCYNGGTCTDLVNGFTCACRRGYEGIRCEIEIDECFSSPCLNNGLCRDLNASYQCVCDEKNFTGERCHIDVRESCGNSTDHNHPCLNGGLCRNVTTENAVSHHCECPPLFTGPVCDEEEDLCENRTCLHGGTCLPLKQTLTSKCECTIGYGGDDCSSAVKICSNETCHNNATCRNTDEGYVCDCGQGYVGEHCEHFDLCDEDLHEVFLSK